MFDLAKAELLSLSQNFLLAAISLVLVIVPLSSSFAAELQDEPEIELTKRGSLRVRYQGSDNQQSSITQKEHDLVEQFALENKLATEWIAVDEDWQLMPSLIEGRGDIIIGQGESLASGLSDQMQLTFVKLLEQDDPDLLMWFSKKSEPEDAALAELVSAIKTVAEGGSMVKPAVTQRLLKGLENLQNDFSSLDQPRSVQDDVGLHKVPGPPLVVRPPS